MQYKYRLKKIHQNKLKTIQMENYSYCHVWTQTIQCCVKERNVFLESDKMEQYFYWNFINRNDVLKTKKFTKHVRNSPLSTLYQRMDSLAVEEI